MVSMRFLLVLMAAMLAAQAQPNTLTSAEKAAGWKLLFDGKTMRGWEDQSKLTPPGDSWTIDDGCLKSVPKPRLREDLISLEKFGDFELSFEWKIAPKGNSGLKYRLQDRFWVNERRISEFGKFEKLAIDAATKRNVKRSEATQEYIVAFEYQLIDNAAHLDAIRGALYQSGALYGMIPPSQQTAKPVGEFNVSRIVLRGNHVEHWLNGVKVVDGMMDSDDAKAKIASRWPVDSPIYKSLAEQPHKVAPITLQNHGDAAWFRSIKVRALTGTGR